jgi:hypothetical protein
MLRTVLILPLWSVLALGAPGELTALPAGWPVQLPSKEDLATARAAVARVNALLARREMPGVAGGSSLDWDWLRAQRTNAWRGFLADVTGPDFETQELRGCVRGWKTPLGGGSAYGVAGRLLDWAVQLPEGSDRTRAMAWIRDHVLHVIQMETWWGPDLLPRVAAEAVNRHPPLSEADIPDTDHLRHWCLEPYARAVLEPAVPFTAAEREGVRLWILGWAVRLLQMTAGQSMVVTNVFYEGAHSRLFFTIDNLTWAYLATGQPELLSHAEALVLSSLLLARRGPGTAFPAPWPIWAGSDPWECGGRALGNPNASHRSATWWHVASSGRRLVPLFAVTANPVIQSLLRDWVLTQTEAAIRDGNPMMRGGEVRPELTPRYPTEDDPAPWSLRNAGEALQMSDDAPYQLLVGVQNWVWDGDYHSPLLPDGRPRMRYTGAYGLMIDYSNAFGGADLWWCRYLLTSDEADRERALVLLRDRLYWANSPGPWAIVTLRNRTGFPYNGGNVGRARTFAWTMECGSLMY